MQKLLPSARTSLLLATAGIVTTIIFREPPATRPSTPYEQGRAEGHAYGIIILFAIGLIAAVVALRAVKKHNLPKIDFYAASLGLVINLAGVVLTVVGLFHS